VRKPPHGRVVGRVNDTTWRILWRGIQMEAAAEHHRWVYRCDDPIRANGTAGYTPREAVKYCGRVIELGGGFSLVRLCGMYGYWYLYKGSRYSKFSRMVCQWGKRPPRSVVLSTIALEKLEEST
jgi:hypothetical protein